MGRSHIGFIISTRFFPQKGKTMKSRGYAGTYLKERKVLGVEVETF